MRINPLQNESYSAALIGSGQVCAQNTPQTQRAIADIASQHERTFSSMQELEGRLIAALGRLGVTHPSQPPSAAKEPDGKGHLPEMQRIAQYTAQGMERLHALLTELERCI